MISAECGFPPGHQDEPIETPYVPADPHIRLDRSVLFTTHHAVDFDINHAIARDMAAKVITTGSRSAGFPPSRFMPPQKLTDAATTEASSQQPRAALTALEREKLAFLNSHSDDGTYRSDEVHQNSSIAVRFDGFDQPHTRGKPALTGLRSPRKQGDIPQLWHVRSEFRSQSPTGLASGSEKPDQRTSALYPRSLHVSGARARAGSTASTASSNTDAGSTMAQIGRLRTVLTKLQQTEHTSLNTHDTAVLNRRSPSPVETTPSSASRPRTRWPDDEEDVFSRRPRSGPSSHRVAPSAQDARRTRSTSANVRRVRGRQRHAAPQAPASDVIPPSPPANEVAQPVGQRVTRGPPLRPPLQQPSNSAPERDATASDARPIGDEVTDAAMAKAAALWAAGLRSLQETTLTEATSIPVAVSQLMPAPETLHSPQRQRKERELSAGGMALPPSSRKSPLRTPITTTKYTTLLSPYRTRPQKHASPSPRTRPRASPRRSLTASPAQPAVVSDQDIDALSSILLGVSRPSVVSLVHEGITALEDLATLLREDYKKDFERVVPVLSDRLKITRIVQMRHATPATNRSRASPVSFQQDVNNAVSLHSMGSLVAPVALPGAVGSFRHSTPNEIGLVSPVDGPERRSAMPSFVSAGSPRGGQSFMSPSKTAKNDGLEALASDLQRLATEVTSGRTSSPRRSFQAAASTKGKKSFAARTDRSVTTGLSTSGRRVERYDRHLSAPKNSFVGNVSFPSPESSNILETDGGYHTSSSSPSVEPTSGQPDQVEVHLAAARSRLAEFMDSALRHRGAIRGPAATAIAPSEFAEAVLSGSAVSGNCPSVVIQDGRGVVRLPSGDVYSGDIVGGLRHGSGALTTADGNTVYVGEWEHDRPHGQGTLEDKLSGQSYEGEWFDGVFHGHGVLMNANGESLLGDWRNGQLDGFGVHHWPGGCYEGQFVSNVKNGLGTARVESGTWTGLWKRDALMSGARIDNPVDESQCN